VEVVERDIFHYGKGGEKEKGEREKGRRVEKGKGEKNT
jgi:hypothetical protein